MIPTFSKVDQLTLELVALHGVIRFAKGDKLQPEELIGVAKRFGSPQAFSLQRYRPTHFPPEITVLDSQGDGVNAAPSGFGEGWHQDSTYLAVPPAFTVLHAMEVPASGGDTLFADTRPAIRSLSKSEFDALSHLKLLHALRASYRISTDDVGKTIGEVTGKLPHTWHSAVIRHPRGGDTLYLSPLYTKDHLDPNSRTLFDHALEEVLKSQVVHKWSVGDVLIWDNRIVLHAASEYRGSQRRLMMRSVVHDVGVDV